MPSSEFDPYRKWLGIRSAQRPPTHYQLLGLEPFEDDAETISHAVDQRMGYLRTLAASEHVDASQKLLNELAGARVCLLNEQRKLAYDAQLRARQTPAAPPVNSDPPSVAPLPPSRSTPPLVKPVPAAPTQSYGPEVGETHRAALSDAVPGAAPLSPSKTPPFVPGFRPIVVPRIPPLHGQAPRNQASAVLPRADAPSARTQYSRSLPRPRWAAPLLALLVCAAVVVVGLFMLDGGKSDPPRNAGKPAITRVSPRLQEPNRAKPSRAARDEGRRKDEQPSVVMPSEFDRPANTPRKEDVGEKDAPDGTGIVDDSAAQEGGEQPSVEMPSEFDRPANGLRNEDVAEKDVPDGTDIVDDSTAAQAGGEPEPTPQRKPSARVQQLIEQLSDPSAEVRGAAVVALGRVRGNDAEPACLAIISALDDISAQVRVNASVFIGGFGPLANSAVPALVARYRADRGNWAESLKISAIGALGAINGDSEIGIRLLIEVTRGAGGGKARLFSKEYSHGERLAAVNAIAKIGSRAEKAVPVILEVLKLSALRLDNHADVFLACTEALAEVGMLDPVKAALKRIREGKGVEPPSMVEMARVAADTALRRLEQSGRSDKQPKYRESEDGLTDDKTRGEEGASEKPNVRESRNPKKFDLQAAKGNMRLVQTKQATQVQCPLTGKDLNTETAIEVGGVTVCFCCNGCKAKVLKAQGDEQVQLVFNDDAFKRGFTRRWLKRTRR